MTNQELLDQQIDDIVQQASDLRMKFRLLHSETDKTLADAGDAIIAASFDKLIASVTALKETLFA